MAGLLGDNWDDPKSAAIMALAGGLLQGNFGAGLNGAQQAYSGAKRGLLEREDAMYKRKLTDAQLRNYDSEIEARGLKGKQDARQQELIASFMGGGAAPAGGGMGGGSPGAPVGGGAGGAGGAGGIMALAQQYGIPQQAIQADMLFNGGKKISELLAKHGAPDMQVSNGYAYNKNGLGAGFMPSQATTASGQTSMTRIGPDGLPVVSAPAGAIDTYSSYRNADEAAKAGSDLVKVVDPATGTEKYVTRSQAVQAAQPQPQPPAIGPRPSASEAGMRPQMQGGMGADPAALQREIGAMQRDMGNVDPASRKMMQDEIVRLQGQQTALGPMQASPSTAQAVEKERMLKQATADIEPTGQKQSSLASGEYLENLLGRAISHPGRETATGKSGALDPRNYLPGTDAKNFRVMLDQLKGSAFLQAFANLKGGGQITEVEGKKATDAIARLDTAQSDGEFKGALEDFQSVVRAANGRMRSRNQGGATGGWEPAGKNSTISAGGWSATLKK